MRKGVEKETAGKKKDREADRIRNRDRDRRGRKTVNPPPVVGNDCVPGLPMALLGKDFPFFCSGQGQAHRTPQCLGRTELSEASCWPGLWWW